MKTDYALWFFSTCAQTFGALVSLFGMFILYRLQIEEGRIGHLRGRMVGLHDAHARLSFEDVLIELQRLQMEHRRSEKIALAQGIQDLLNDYAGATNKRVWLRNSAEGPIIALVGLIFVSLICIPMEPWLARFPRVLMGCVWGILAMTALPLWNIGSIILTSMNAD